MPATVFREFQTFGEKRDRIIPSSFKLRSGSIHAKSRRGRCNDIVVRKVRQLKDECLLWRGFSRRNASSWSSDYSEKTSFFISSLKGNAILTRSHRSACSDQRDLENSIIPFAWSVGPLYQLPMSYACRRSGNSWKLCGLGAR